MTAVELLQELVRIPSESRKEEAIVLRLKEMFSSFGWTPAFLENNVYVMLGTEGPLLMLNSHTDTVPIGEGWTRPPLGGDVIDGKIYGRGANDAKGPMTAMILGAKAAFAKSPPKGRVCLAFTCEEEVSGKGLENLIKVIPRPDAAVVGEPTCLEPAVAQKGLLILEVTAKGRSAHAAWGGGVNAIELAVKDVAALCAIRFERPHLALGLPSLSVTQIEGGTRHNVIPDRCKLVVDVRTTPAYSPEEIVDKVQAAVQGEVTVRSRRFESVDTDASHPVVKAALAAKPGAKPFGSPTLSEWVSIKGIPTVKVGPGDSRRSHTPDEYIEVAELEEGAAFYEKLIREYLR